MATTVEPTDNNVQILVPGQAEGKLIYSDVPLSFMMGVDPDSGKVIDTHHPLCGNSLNQCILALPYGRGSCSGSGIVLELLLNGRGPAAFIFQKADPILILGIMVASLMFDKSVPVLVIEDHSNFSHLRTADHARISDQELLIGANTVFRLLPKTADASKLALTEKDHAMLNGQHGAACKIAMEIIVWFATMQGAESLVDVSQVHIDACVYMGKSSTLFVERLLSLGARCVVPTTLNSLSVDKRRWRELGSDPEISTAASRLGDGYTAMGAKPSFTCAPYLLDSAPLAGEQIGWAESNAVVFANSVLGARTQKYADYFDVFISLTGRAPYSGCHVSEGRQPRLRIQVPMLKGADDAMFPLLGYHIGQIAGTEIPIIGGLEESNPSLADLKAFSAAFATTSSAPMFHMKGVTPEAAEAARYEHEQNLPQITVDLEELALCWKELNTASDSSVDLVSLGNPHFSLEEFASLCGLVQNRKKHPGTQMTITTSRAVYQDALAAGYLDLLEAFGATFITDTCWCMIQEPVIPVHARDLMTNSAKYAHYGPGIVKRGIHFGSLASCVDAAWTGTYDCVRPSWLADKTTDNVTR
ncbi:Cis-3-hydroxy-L-proline dehydratase [Exophiala dermatitidis]